MDIPEELVTRAVRLIRPPFARDVVLEALRPIDRAARIDELREQAKYLRKVAMDSPVGNGFSPGLLAAANWHEADADALENPDEDEESP